jgi:hypothetical protein
LLFGNCRAIALFTLSILISGCAAQAQTQNAPRSEVAGIPVNYDESRVGTFTLPDPLVLADGKPVRDAKAWNQKRRPEIVRLFEENQFGRSPGRPAGMSFDVFDKGTPALDGKALRRQVTVYFSQNKTGPKMDLLLYLPANASKPVPVLLNLSFSANSSTIDDPGIKARRGLESRQTKGARNARQKFRKAECCTIPGAGLRRGDNLLR